MGGFLYNATPTSPLKCDSACPEAQGNEMNTRTRSLQQAGLFTRRTSVSVGGAGETSPARMAKDKRVFISQAQCRSAASFHLLRRPGILTAPSPATLHCL